MAHYTKASLVEALANAGLRKGDVVFTHSNVGFFGIPAEGRENAVRVILESFQEVLGEEGTLVTPAFTYSFARQEPFDLKTPPWEVGLFAEYVLNHPDSVRSDDPLFSVAAFGKRARPLTDNISKECFGKDSFWDRFYETDGVICNMNLDASSTYIHYVEKCLGVPYLYDKLFTGTTIKNGTARKTGVVFFCRDLTNPDTFPNYRGFARLALEQGVARTVSVGRGFLTVIRARDVFRLIQRELRTRPWILTMAGAAGRAPVLLRNGIPPTVPLGPESSMVEMIEKLWKLPREAVTDGFDTALYSLARVADMTIHRFPTGAHCWTWIVPEKWTCHEASLETTDGNKIIDYADNPLHCMSYSLPFQGVVRQDELVKHLHVHPHIPEAIPYVHKLYDRDWGLCCPRTVRDSLTQEQYRVTIQTEYSYGELKVGEVIVPGESGDTFILCAHLCHTYMTNDDLSGVAVGLEVMRRLKRRSCRYTYRLLLVPEYIGSIAWLSRHEELIPKMKGGLFLEMLGRNAPFSLQLSFQGNTQADRCLLTTFKSLDPDGWVGNQRTVVQNDENIFNAPGVRVPMLSLSRVEPPDSPTRPYREYHSNFDDLSQIFPDRLDGAASAVLRMLENFERNFYVINKFKGEIFCSRYGLFYDALSNLYKAADYIDGTKTVADIADLCHLSFDECWDFVRQAHEHGLVDFSTSPLTTALSSPHFPR